MDEQRLILIVEDDEATRAFLAENIAADGFRVASATSSRQAAGSTCSTASGPRTAWRRVSTRISR